MASCLAGLRVCPPLHTASSPLYLIHPGMALTPSQMMTWVEVFLNSASFVLFLLHVSYGFFVCICVVALCCRQTLNIVCCYCEIENIIV